MCSFGMRDKHEMEVRQLVWFIFAHSMDFGFFWYMARFSIHEKYFEALRKLCIRIKQYLYENYSLSFYLMNVLQISLNNTNKNIAKQLGNN